jgi:hypothetical protein
VTPFDYTAAADLFPARGRGARQSVGYRRFEHAVDAIRFAIEELPADLLGGAYLEVGEDRFDQHGIRELYQSSRYPLERRSAPPMSADKGDANSK